MEDSISRVEKPANQFTLSDSEGRTNIIFSSERSPSTPETQPHPAQLVYRGIEGVFTFTGNEITRQASRLGHLMTVILQENGEVGILEFTLVLPPIHLAGQQERDFTTIGIKTKRQGLAVLPVGAELTYEGFALRGVAEVVVVPDL
jgi:hypothetical protein